MSSAGNSEQFDADMLQCKVDILRARNIIRGAPQPHNDTTGKNPAAQNSTRETTQSSDSAEMSTHKDTNSTPIETQPAKETPPLLIEKTNHTDTAKQPEPGQGPSNQNNAPEVQADQIKPIKDTAAKSGGNEREKSEIPSFDLAEDIMAEQRKITAIRRKAPGKKTEAQRAEPQAPPFDHTIEQPTPAMSEQEKIIAEIVARDIEKLCRGDYSANSE